MASARAERLKQHIDECKEVLAENNPQKAAKKVETMGRAYYNEKIDFGIKPIYDKFGNIIYESAENLKNLECLIIQMEIMLGQWIDEYNIKQLELDSMQKQKDNNNSTNAINISNTNTANATINQNISIDNAIKSINELSNDILDKKSKEYLEEILLAIESLKDTDKEKTKGKIIKVLKYIADKGIEVCIAILPYLGEIARLLKL